MCNIAPDIVSFSFNFISKKLNIGNIIEFNQVLFILREGADGNKLKRHILFLYPYGFTFKSNIHCELKDSLIYLHNELVV